MEENEILSETDIGEVNEELFCDEREEASPQEEVETEEISSAETVPADIPETEKYERTGIYMTDEKASPDSLLRKAFGLA